MKIPPCWFCNSEDTEIVEVFGYISPRKYAGGCRSCGAQGPLSDTREGAVDPWCKPSYAGKSERPLTHLMRAIQEGKPAWVATIVGVKNFPAPRPPLKGSGMVISRSTHVGTQQEAEADALETFHKLHPNYSYLNHTCMEVKL